MPPVKLYPNPDELVQRGPQTDPTQCLAGCELLFYGLIGLVIVLLVSLIVAVVGHIYMCTCQNSANHEKDIAELNKQLREKDATNANQHHTITQMTEQYKQNITDLEIRLRDSSNRLAKEMGTKIAADETSVENIGIRNRPMNIADDYQRLCSNEWLDAKTQLDEVIGADAGEEIKLTFLCSIMQLVEEHLSACVTNMYKSLVENHSVLLPSSQSTQESEPQKLPLEISNAIGDYLRNNVHNINIEHFNKAIREKLDDKYKELDSIWFKSKNGNEMQAYIKKVITVVLGMAIQRPPMKFQISNEWKDDDSVDLNWGSLNPADPLYSGVSLKVTPVHPMLYHGNKLMVKGKVHVTEIETVEADDSQVDQFESDKQSLI